MTDDGRTYTEDEYLAACRAAAARLAAEDAEPGDEVVEPTDRMLPPSSVA